MTRLILLLAGAAAFAPSLTAQRILEGEGPEDLGIALVVLDFDGDGCADIVAGAPRHTSEGKHYRGRLVIARGSRKQREGDETLPAWLGPDSSAGLGTSLAAADLDGDGAPELIAGAPGRNEGRGTVYVFRGGKGGGETLSGGDVGAGGGMLALDGTSELGGFGRRVAAGDLDGDGLAELVVAEPLASTKGAPQAGRVLVFAGRKSWKVPAAKVGDAGFEPALVLVGREREALGTSLLVADVTGDATLDLVALTPHTRHVGHDGTGSAVVIAGRKGLLDGRTLVMDRDDPDLVVFGRGGDLLGTAAATIDLDRDGQDELVLGEPARDAPRTPEAGAVHVLPRPLEAKRVDLGKLGALRVVSWTGAAAHERFGGALFSGTIDGEPAKDLLVGSPGAGRVVLFRDPAAQERTPPPARAFMAPANGGKDFGTSVGAGDVDGDGKPEIVIGAPGSSRVFVY